MAKTGRPRKEINQKLFENLCGIQCTEVEICAALECSDDTLTVGAKEHTKRLLRRYIKAKAKLESQACGGCSSGLRKKMQAWQFGSVNNTLVRETSQSRRKKAGLKL